MTQIFEPGGGLFQIQDNTQFRNFRLEGQFGTNAYYNLFVDGSLVRTGPAVDAGELTNILLFGDLSPVTNARGELRRLSFVQFAAPEPTTGTLAFVLLSLFISLCRNPIFGKKIG